MKTLVKELFKDASQDYKSGYCEALGDVITLLDSEPVHDVVEEIFDVLEEYGED